MSKPKQAKKVREKAQAEEEKASIEFGFIVVKTEEGFRVTPLSDEKGEPMFSPTPDKVYNACHNICNNINIERTAQAVGQSMVAAAMQAQGKSEGGVVLP